MELVLILPKLSNIFLLYSLQSHLLVCMGNTASELKFANMFLQIDESLLKLNMSKSSFLYC